MKKIIFLICFALIGAMLTSCVTLRGGLNFGSEKSTFDSPGFSERTPVDTKSQVAISNTSSETGFYIGLALNAEELQFSDDFGIQPEVNFVGIKDLNQIQVPVLARYNFAEGFNAYAGPNFGLLLDTPDGIKSFNFALDIGVSYDISDNFLLEARYDHGISNLLENGGSDFSVRLRNFQVGVAYRFDE